MEKKVVTVYPSDKNEVNEEHLIFDWQIEKETTKNNGKIQISYIRNDSTKYYQKLVELEDEFKPKIIPLFIALIPTILAFILISIFFVLYLTTDDHSETAKNLLFFIIPSSLLMFTTVILVFLRMKALQEYLLNKSKKIIEYKQKVQELKSSK